MSHQWRRLARVVAIFAVVGWLAAVCVGSTEDDANLRGLLLSGATVRSAIIGGLAGVIWGPTLAWARPPVWAGIPVGLISAVTGLFMYFFVFPHDWQGGRMEAWKSVKVMVGVYWMYLVPLAMLGGVLAAWWSRLGVPKRGWQKVAAEGPAPPSDPTAKGSDGGPPR